MDFIKTLLAEKGSDLVAQLVNKAGFDAGQAEAFVPEAVGSVSDAVKEESNPADLLSDPAALSSKIDIGALASRVGISPEKAQAGLNAILPHLSSFLGEKAGGLGAIAGALGAGSGGLGGAVSGVAGKLFQK